MKLRDDVERPPHGCLLGWLMTSGLPHQLWVCLNINLYHLIIIFPIIISPLWLGKFKYLFWVDYNSTSPAATRGECSLCDLHQILVAILAAVQHNGIKRKEKGALYTYMDTVDKK